MPKPNYLTKGLDQAKFNGEDEPFYRDFLTFFSHRKNFPEDIYGFLR